jgi:tRNA A37 threonylcarbamoyladenosine dehydratase
MGGSRGDLPVKTPGIAGGGSIDAVPPRLQRLALVTGASAIRRLRETSAAVVGLGGVGSWCAEALARCGIGALTLIDSDAVCVTNINRQVQATVKTVGQLKTDALRERILEISPDCEITVHSEVFSKETEADFGLGRCGFVIDAIDSLTSKLDLIELCGKLGVTLFSSMGMAQKLDPLRLKTASIWKTSGCALARLVRAGLRKRGFSGDFTVIYSDERLPIREGVAVSCGSGACLCPSRVCGAEETAKEWCSSKKVINGSAVMVTAAAGMALASLVVRSVVDAGA